MSFAWPNLSGSPRFTSGAMLAAVRATGFEPIPIVIASATDMHRSRVLKFMAGTLLPGLRPDGERCDECGRQKHKNAVNSHIDLQFPLSFLCRSRPSPRLPGHNEHSRNFQLHIVSLLCRTRERADVPPANEIPASFRPRPERRSCGRSNWKPHGCELEEFPQPLSPGSSALLDRPRGYRRPRSLSDPTN
jgi:hypothetical protein